MGQVAAPSRSHHGVSVKGVGGRAFLAAIMVAAHRLTFWSRQDLANTTENEMQEAYVSLPRGAPGTLSLAAQRAPEGQDGLV